MESQINPMALILDNPNGGRRSIRLNAADISMIVASYQIAFKNKKMPSYQALTDWIGETPLYLPEDV